jgi:hypothetical protein
MTKVSKNRVTEREAVNKLKALLEQQNHVVEEIAGQNDFGEDLYLTFVEAGRVTGDVAKIQVKSGVSYRRANGYAVPVKHHADQWTDCNVPVICVVHDPETGALYWANATKQLRRERSKPETRRTIKIEPDARLEEQSMSAFVAEIRHYAACYRGAQAIRTYLSEMSGVEFEPTDLVQHFVNDCDEDLIFWQKQGEGHATLLHLDWDFNPVRISPDLFSSGPDRLQRLGYDDFLEWLRDEDEALYEHSQRLDGPALEFQARLLLAARIGIILNETEVQWLTTCFSATSWARKAREHR